MVFQFYYDFDPRINLASPGEVTISFSIEFDFDNKLFSVTSKSGIDTEFNKKGVSTLATKLEHTISSGDFLYTAFDNKLYDTYSIELHNGQRHNSPNNLDNKIRIH